MMIYQREFRRNVKSLVIWTAALGAYIILLLSIYPQFASNQEMLNQMMEAYPENLKKAFGMDTMSIGTMLGFYGVEVYMFTTLIGSIYAAILASGILVKEESEKTIEFLLSKPIHRQEIVLQKLAAVFTNLFVFNLGLTLVSVLGFQLSNEQESLGGVFFMLSFAAFLLHLTIASISFLLSSMMRKNRNIVSISLGLVLLFYAMNIAAGVSEQMEFLGHFSLFHYVDAAAIVENEALDPIYVSVMILLSVLCIASAFIYYKKKDITI